MLFGQGHRGHVRPKSKAQLLLNSLKLWPPLEGRNFAILLCEGNNIFSNFGSKTFDSLEWDNHASCFKQSIFLLGAVIFLLGAIGSWTTGVGSTSGSWTREMRQTTKGRRSREKATSFVG
jgi:hypothetical protein